MTRLARCGAVCPRNQYVTCEYPPDHVVGGLLGGEPQRRHLGRDRYGKWWSWEPTETALMPEGEMDGR